MRYQYLKENPDGSRHHVSEWAWREDRAKKNYQQIHAIEGVIIYRMV